MDLDALANGGVRLLRLDTDLLDDDPARLGSPFEGVRTLFEMQSSSLVVPVRPAATLAEGGQTARCVEPRWRRHIGGGADHKVVVFKVRAASRSAVGRRGED